jgi:hypothetical protein
MLRFVVKGPFDSLTNLLRCLIFMTEVNFLSWTANLSQSVVKLTENQTGFSPLNLIVRYYSMY